MTSHSVIHDFSNIGWTSPERSFFGFPKAQSGTTHRLAAREAKRFDMQPGDLLSLSGRWLTSDLQIGAFDSKGKDALAALGVNATGKLDMNAADCRALLGWVTAMGGNASCDIPVTNVPASEDQVVFSVKARVTVWVVRLGNNEQLVSGALNSWVTASFQPAKRNTPILPPELGDVRDEFTVARGTGVAYELAPGEVVQIIDVEGQQCSDFLALRTDGLDRGEELLIDNTATRSLVRRSYPGPGSLDKFFDQDMNPLLNVLQDTCGRHDTFGLACTARGYEERGFPGHVNCSDNISAALDPFGVRRRSAWPAINFFWNTWVDPHTHDLRTAESYSRPGDYVAMRAMERLTCVSTACPDDIDPINGWNPTDVHVRIYKSNTPIRRAVAYREKEDAPMSLSQESAFFKRLEPLTQDFAPARDLWAPVSFPSVGSIGEYWACREAVTLQDMSGLRKFDIIGPDAEKLLQLATTRNVAKLSVWRGSYTLMCDQTGAVIDDGTLFRLSDHLFRWCCGTEESARVLEALALENNLHVRIHAMRGSLPNLALQGPRSRDLLRKIVFTQPHVPSLEQLKWFGVTIGRLHSRDGAPFMLSRSGYTGELGYEVFCSQADALLLWDALMEAGQEFNITPMGSAALETIRIEAGLAAAGAEFTPGVDAFEAGLGFAIDLNKPEFVGKGALTRNAENPRRVLKGMTLGGSDVPANGAPIFAGERQIGEVTSATYSPTFECAIAMVRLSIEFSETGTRLEIGQLDGRLKRLGGVVVDIPFVDPQRTRARA